MNILATQPAPKSGVATVDLFGPITEFSAEIDSPDAVSEVIANAFRAAESGRPGAAFVSAAADVVLAVGYNPIESEPGLWNHDKSRTLIHVDVVPADIDKDCRPQLELTGNIAVTIEQPATGLEGGTLPIAACLVRPDQKVVSISGDGGFLFFGDGTRDRRQA